MAGFQMVLTRSPGGLAVWFHETLIGQYSWSPLVDPDVLLQKI
ncbi:hypothetical protein [Camelimonas lactis]|nr:hypothetical protein [Camelimonas lactis]